jgi:LPXTG-site transpeptidase (sortase) family protein
MVKFRGKKLKIVWIGTGIVILVTAIILIFSLGQKDPIPEQEQFDSSSIVTESLAQPDESIPEERGVPADLPKRVTIPQLDIDGLIQLVSTDQYGRIAVPSNIHVAGWYINSVKPGENGLSIISGHRNGKVSLGIFYNLERLKKDDKITIEFGDGSLRDFLVIDVIQIETEKAQNIMYERLEGVEKQLVLVTCGGEYDKELKTYIDRVIVRAKGI